MLTQSTGRRIPVMRLLKVDPRDVQDHVKWSPGHRSIECLELCYKIGKEGECMRTCSFDFNHDFISELTYNLAVAQA